MYKSDSMVLKDISFVINGQLVILAGSSEAKEIFKSLFPRISFDVICYIIMFPVI